MKKKTVIYCLCAFILQSCHFFMVESKKNETIDLSIRQKIETLNDQLFNGIKNNDMRSVHGLLTLALIEKSGDNLNKIINALNTPKINRYSLFDQYYVRTTFGGSPIVLNSGNSGKDEYVFKFTAPAKESFVLMSLLNNLGDKMLLTAIYGKYPDGWKISFLWVSSYSFFGKTAQDYYGLARESYHKSYLVDAFVYMSTAALCMQPAGPNCQFKKEREMKEFQDKPVEETSSAYHFPIVLTGIASKPEIIKVFPKLENDGFFPTVCYLSKINLKDTMALKAENKEVQKGISGVFTGIKKDKKCVLYSAFNELPVDRTKLYHQYGFVEDLIK